MKCHNLTVLTMRELGQISVCWLIFGHKNFEFCQLKRLLPSWASQSCQRHWLVLRQSQSCMDRVCAAFIWIKAWLRDRPTKCWARSDISWWPVTSDVPKVGDILGPLCLISLSAMWMRGRRAPSVLFMAGIPCPEDTFLISHYVSSSRPFWKWFGGFGDFWWSWSPPYNPFPLPDLIPAFALCCACLSQKLLPYLHMAPLPQPNLVLSHGSMAIQLPVFGTHIPLFSGNWELTGSHFGPWFIGSQENGF